MMTTTLLYFAGLDLHDCVIPIEEKSSSSLHKCCEVPQVVNSNITNIHTRFDFIVFQKKGEKEEDFSWYIKGEGIKGEVEAFSSNNCVNQICLTANSLVGFSDKNNSLYRIDFRLCNDAPKFFELVYISEKKPTPDPVSIKQIVTNHSQSVFVLDDHSGIYEIVASNNNEINLILKWRLEGVEIIKLACGFGHFIALSDTGALYSWGCGGRGELGHLENDHVMTNCEQPKRIEFFDDLPCIVKDVSCGGWHTLALTSDGDIYSFGWNESGQLGYSTASSGGNNKNSMSPSGGGVPYPVDIGSGEDPVVQISAGARHSLAVLKSGRCFSWGLNKQGQLGVGDFDNRNEPVEIKFNNNSEQPKNKKLVRIECGRWSTFFYFE